MSGLLGGVMPSPAGSALARIASQRQIMDSTPDLAQMAQARRLELEGEGRNPNVNDAAEQKKAGIARRAKKTKKALFGGNQGLLSNPALGDDNG